MSQVLIPHSWINWEEVCCTNRELNQVAVSSDTSALTTGLSAYDNINSTELHCLLGRHSRDMHSQDDAHRPASPTRSTSASIVAAADLTTFRWNPTTPTPGTTTAVVTPNVPLSAAVTSVVVVVILTSIFVVCCFRTAKKRRKLQLAYPSVEMITPGIRVIRRSRVTSNHGGVESRVDGGSVNYGYDPARLASPVCVGGGWPEARHPPGQLSGTAAILRGSTGGDTTTISPKWRARYVTRRHDLTERKHVTGTQHNLSVGRKYYVTGGWSCGRTRRR